MPCLHLVAHSVDLLDVGEDHLGVDPAVPHHGVHVVGGKEVRDASVAPKSFKISVNLRFNTVSITHSPVLKARS